MTPLPVIGRNEKSSPCRTVRRPVHGDHAHAVTGELFPLIGARFIRWFGLRGAYILPANRLSGNPCWLRLATLVALTHGEIPALVVLLAALAAPFLFYGLEFWEHAPAVALATFGTAMFVSAFRTRTATAAFALWTRTGVRDLLFPPSPRNGLGTRRSFWLARAAPDRAVEGAGHRLRVRKDASASFAGASGGGGNQTLPTNAQTTHSTRPGSPGGRSAAGLVPLPEIYTVGRFKPDHALHSHLPGGPRDSFRGHWLGRTPPSGHEGGSSTASWSLSGAPAVLKPSGQPLR